MPRASAGTACRSEDVGGLAEGRHEGAPTATVRCLLSQMHRGGGLMAPAPFLSFCVEPAFAQRHRIVRGVRATALHRRGAFMAPADPGQGRHEAAPTARYERWLNVETGKTRGSGYEARENAYGGVRTSEKCARCVGKSHLRTLPRGFVPCVQAFELGKRIRRLPDGAWRSAQLGKTRKARRKFLLAYSYRRES